MANPRPQSVLLVEVPEAEPAVGRYRERFVASARLGVPAHITVLFPFMSPQAISPAVIAELEHVFAAVSRFRFRLTHTNWFGDEVLWLGARDPAPFRALTRYVAETFPEFPPYEGQFSKTESHPHLTVGKTAETLCRTLNGREGHPVTELRSAESGVRSHLPIDGEATSVTLMTQASTGGQWTKTATFLLA
jgi:2'-5' RNA ligase superfamily